MANINDSLPITLKFEGGYGNDPDDPGGETNFGITKKTALAHGYNGDMRKIPMDVVTKIYKVGYWDALKLDDVNSQLFANNAFDCAVNMGTGISAKMMQNAANNVDPDANLTVDGAIGSHTIQAINTITDDEELEQELNTAFADLRGQRYNYLVQRNPVLAKYIKGWMKRCDVNV